MFLARKYLFLTNIAGYWKAKQILANEQTMQSVTEDLEIMFIIALDLFDYHDRIQTSF